MFIHEATKEALESDKYITLKGSEEAIKIKPDLRLPFTIMHADGSHPSKYGWQPTAEELMGNDWIIVD